MEAVRAAGLSAVCVSQSSVVQTNHLCCFNDRVQADAFQLSRPTAELSRCALKCSPLPTRRGSRAALFQRKRPAQQQQHPTTAHRVVAVLAPLANQGTEEVGGANFDEFLKGAASALRVKLHFVAACSIAVGTGLGLIGGGGHGSNGGGGGGGWGGGGGGGGNEFFSGPWQQLFGTKAALAAEDDEDEDEEDEDDEEEEEDEESDETPDVEEGTSDAKKGAKSPGTEEDAYDEHGMKAGTRVPVAQLSNTKRYRVGDVELIDQRNDRAIAKDDGFMEMVSVRKGIVAAKAQLEAELNNLLSSGMFQNVTMDAVANADGTIKVEVKFLESQWNPARSVKCVNVGLIPMDSNAAAAGDEESYRRRMNSARPCLLPKKVEAEISRWLSRESRLTARMLQRVRDRILRWYNDEGYMCAQVVNFGNLNTDEIVCEVVEGDITGVEIQFLDRFGQQLPGRTDPRVIRRELPPELKAGHVFNIEAGKKALQHVNALQLFSNLEVNPRVDEQLEGGIVVEVKVKEMEPKNVELQTEWSIAPGDTGKPCLVTLEPGGTVMFEHRNIHGLNRSINASVTAPNLINPKDELGFKFEYVHPNIDGLDDPRNRTGRVIAFNNRKLSAVFVGGPRMEDIPLVWVDRWGVKANVTDTLGRHSKQTYGFVAENVTTRDEQDLSACTFAARPLPNGTLSADGPPTTLSGTPSDHLVFLQANLTRDNTQFVNGTPVGTRVIFQVDQGLGIGSASPFFNRHQLTATKFLQLGEESKEEANVPPPTAVLHLHYGHCLGDIPPYDAFTLGGPYSVRGYNVGELGASRRKLELAGEMRVPVKGSLSYAFAEFGTDLGSSSLLQGNPTEFFHRAGHGFCYGAGLKVGAARVEYARDCNSGTGSWFVRFGERF